MSTFNILSLNLDRILDWPWYNSKSSINLYGSLLFNFHILEVIIEESIRDDFLDSMSLNALSDFENSDKDSGDLIPKVLWIKSFSIMKLSKAWIQSIINNSISLKSAGRRLFGAHKLQGFSLEIVW